MYEEKWESDLPRYLSGHRDRQNAVLSSLLIVPFLPCCLHPTDIISTLFEIYVSARRICRFCDLHSIPATPPTGKSLS